MWEKINKFVCSRAVLSAFLLSTLFILAITALGVSLLDMAMPGRLMVFTIGQLILASVAIWLMRKLEVFDRDDFRLKGLGKGLLLAWFGFVYIIISFFINFMQIPISSFIAPNIPSLIIIVLHPFIGTGLFEEVLYRGLVLKMLLRKTGHSKKGVIFACVISSAIFGLLHIVNVFAGAPVLSTISQIIHATATGLFFAAVFLRTKKLWIPILLHGLLNLSAQIFDAIVPPDFLLQSLEAQTGADIPGLTIYTLFVTLPILIAALVLLRKAEPYETSNEKINVPGS